MSDFPEPPAFFELDGVIFTRVFEHIQNARGYAECDIDPEFGEIDCRVNGRRVSPRVYREFLGRTVDAQDVRWAPREIAP